MAEPVAVPCRCSKTLDPAVTRKSGRAGRISSTRWYRETVTCLQCRISVTAGTPGNAIRFWNRANSPA